MTDPAKKIDVIIRNAIELPVAIATGTLSGAQGISAIGRTPESATTKLVLWEPVKAEEMRLGPLLEGPKQYVVPYFQRAYSWRRRQWTTSNARNQPHRSARALRAHVPRDSAVPKEPAEAKLPLSANAAVAAGRAGPPSVVT